MNKEEVNKLKTGFKKGYVVNKIKTDNQLNKKFAKVEKKYSNQAYPNGLGMLVFLALFYVIFTIVVVAVGFTKHSDIFFYQWYWSTLCASTIYLLLNILWIIGRTGYASSIEYGILKIARIIRARKLIEIIEYRGNEPAVNDVTNLNEYNSYCELRRKYTKKYCYISLCISVIVFLINIIVSFTYYYVAIEN